MWLCNEGQKLFTEWNNPTLNVRYHQIRNGTAKAVHTLLQSSHVAGDRQQTGYPRWLEPTNMDESCIVTCLSMLACRAC